jgi:RND family efflux transporter MFP subunit
VDVAVARLGFLETPQTFTGTTRPFQEVVLRSQVEGQLLQLKVDAGDRVQRGQIIAQVDAALLQAAVLQAKAELAAREAEVVQAQTQVNTARTTIEQARLQLAQNQADAARLEKLTREGAVSAQAAEQARTTANTAQQVLRSAQVQLNTAQQAVAAAQGRVQAQRAVIAQNQQRTAYSIVTAPLSGVVLQRLTETGNLLRPGEGIVSLGDLTQLKVVVELAEVVAATVRVGQPVRVRFDSMGQQEFTGVVQRITPVASTTARLVPIEIRLANPAGRLGSGLLARVQFSSGAPRQVVVPISALSANAPNPSRPENPELKEGTVFVVAGKRPKLRVQARPVQLGTRGNGVVEIRAGLQPGERFVTRSGRPLKDGTPVRPSILSER